MGAEEAFKKLAGLINMAYYIGPTGVEAIRNACCGEEDSVPEPEPESEPEPENTEEE